MINSDQKAVHVKIGHMAGLIAYGLAATAASVAAGIVESTVRGLAQTGKSLAGELRSAPKAPAPAQSRKAAPEPAEQGKASETPRRRKSRKRSKQKKALEAH